MVRYIVYHIQDSGDSMRKLDNKGFGIGTFVVFIAIFFIAILMIAYLVNYYGIGVEEMNSGGSNTNVARYQKFEAEVRNAAISYMDANYSNVAVGDVLIVDMDRLNVDDEILKDCTGYVKIENNGYFTYHPYLKCGSYQTSGYSSVLGQ